MFRKFLFQIASRESIQDADKAAGRGEEPCGRRQAQGDALGLASQPLRLAQELQERPVSKQ